MGEAQDLTALSGPVHGFVERFNPWTGRAWLQVLGPGRQWVRISSGYGAARRSLRNQYPDRPFTSEWSDGQFPPAPGRLPPHVAIAAGWLAASAFVVAAAVAGGGWAALAAGVAAGWPLLRLLDSVRAGRRGLRLGPPWAAVVPWHEVERIVVEPRGRSTRVWARTLRGGSLGRIPTVLLPALRARVRRLSGLAVVEQGPDLDDTYAVWRQVAFAIPWGILAASSGGAWLTPWPWEVFGVGLLLVGGTSVLAAAVEARASGWGTGGVIWLSVLYALILAILSLGPLL